MRKEESKKEEKVNVSGWRRAISVDVFGFFFFTEMNTFNSPKFSARFEHLGWSRPGHSVLPSKAHQCLVKADYRWNGAHINVNSVPEKLFKLLLFTSTLLNALSSSRGSRSKVGKRSCLLFSPFLRLHPFAHFILGEGYREPRNQESGTLGPCNRNGARRKMKVPVAGLPASSLRDSGKGDAPPWAWVPSSVKRGVRLDNLCRPISSNRWRLDVFFDSLIRSKKPALSLNRHLKGGNNVRLHPRTSVCDPRIREPGSWHSQLLLGQKRACRGQVSHL